MNVRVSIRLKLLLALLVPLAALLAVTVGAYQRADRKLTTVARDNAVAITAIGPGNVARAVQVERNDVAISVINLRSLLTFDATTTAGTMRATDRAVDQFERTLKASSPEIRALYQSSVRSLRSDLVALRARFAANHAPRNLDQADFANSIFIGYSDTAEQLLTANSRATATITDPVLRNGSIVLAGISHLSEEVDVTARTTNYSQVTGGVLGDQPNRGVVLRSFDGLLEAKARLDQAPPGPWTPAVRAVFGTQYRAAVAVVSKQLDSGELDITSAFATFGRMTTPMVRASRSVARDITNRATSLRHQAEDDRRNALLAALLAMLVASGVALAAARSVSRPLRSLARQADDLATTTLPLAVQQVLETPAGEDLTLPHLAPIEVRSRDEVQDIAAALDEVQRAALELAVEQALLGRNVADSFANLGRRTQGLITRQLDLVSDLERDEGDPAALEQLFTLDHLTTRARRNAESLLVLAGIDTPRTFAAPIPMWDVVRSALGEVEAYRRVTVEAVDDALYPGAAAADLVHLLAELIENGLAFSPDDGPVSVTGERTSTGYAIAIRDHGTGMSTDDLATANRRLAGADSFTVAPSTHLGHHVAGHLATRIGVGVEVRAATDGGVLATVTIPLTGLVDFAAPGGSRRTAPEAVDGRPGSAAFEATAPADAAGLFAPGDGDPNGPGALAAPEPMPVQGGTTTHEHEERS